MSHRPSLQQFHDAELVIGDERLGFWTRKGLRRRARSRLEPVLDEGAARRAGLEADLGVGRGLAHAAGQGDAVEAPGFETSIALQESGAALSSVFEGYLGSLAKAREEAAASPSQSS